MQLTEDLMIDRAYMKFKGSSGGCRYKNNILSPWSSAVQAAFRAAAEMPSNGITVSAQAKSNILRGYSYKISVNRMPRRFSPVDMAWLARPEAISSDVNAYPSVPNLEMP